MDFSLWTPLISALLAAAIAVKVVLRSRKRRAHWLFVMFAGNVAIWYLSTFIEAQSGNVGVLGRITALMAILLPQTGVRFLRAFHIDSPQSATNLDRTATWLALPMLAAVATPWFTMRVPGAIIRAAILAYVVGLLIAAVSALYARGKTSPSRQDRRRALYLTGLGVAATLITTADLVPFIAKAVGTTNLPPVGSILVLAVLYLFSEVIDRRRVLDLYELTGRFVVLTALALVLAGTYYALVDWQVSRRLPGGENPYFLNAIVASLVILILFDPVRTKTEQYVGRVFFSERYDLERAVGSLRRRLQHALDLDAMAEILLDGLEASRRVTHGAIWMVDADRRALEILRSVGSEHRKRVDLAAMRALVEHLRGNVPALRLLLAREIEDRQELGETRDAEQLAEVLRAMQTLGGSVVLALTAESGDLLGLVALDDDRVQDPYSIEDVRLLEGVAAQAAIVVENSRLHTRLRERDRLAAMGEMAAGLAHEIRNPLGSIKAAAQFIDGVGGATAQQKEFLGIIVEEVGRLDRVVSSFLDYARPYRGNPSLGDPTGVIERTLNLARADLPAGVTLVVSLPESLPQVRIDPEHLRQVLLNLVRNASEAMQGAGNIAVTARSRGAAAISDHGESQRPGTVEVLVRDTGPGIADSVRQNLFIPFSTTKEKGTGLGLAISHRLMESAGGRLEMRSSDASGTTFVIVLPVAAPLPKSLPADATMSTEPLVAG
jgi:signal transduction histidine kinase